MKETPILFSTPMVQAVLEDRKTKTRRTTGLDFQFEFEQCFADNWNFIGVNLTGHFVFENDSVEGYVTIKCPWGNVGDKLWVRETHKLRSVSDLKRGGVKYQAMYKTPGIKNVYYDKLSSGTRQKLKNVNPALWRPSIFLFKEFSRIWLQVTNIRVERLQDISEADAIAEGIRFDHQVGLYTYNGISYCDKASQSFKELWISINGLESWKANPWVWGVTFLKIEKR